MVQSKSSRKRMDQNQCPLFVYSQTVFLFFLKKKRKKGRELSKLWWEMNWMVAWGWRLRSKICVLEAEEVGFRSDSSEIPGEIINNKYGKFSIESKVKRLLLYRAPWSEVMNGDEHHDAIMVHNVIDFMAIPLVVASCFGYHTHWPRQFWYHIGMGTLQCST